MIQTYHRANKVQRIFSPIVERLFPNKILASFYPFETYSPKYSRLKLTTLAMGVMVCIFTPFTNFLIIPLTRWALK